MSLYSQYETSSELEKSGIWLQFDDNSKGNPVRILVARAGGANTEYLKMLERKAKPYRKQIQHDMLGNDKLIKIVDDVIIETCVLNWENMEDRDGKDLAFNKENVVRVFADLPVLFDEVKEKVQQAAYFRAVLLEDDAKN